MRALYLIRHGEPEFKNDRKVCLGQTDLPLSDRGMDQAAGLKRFLQAIPDKTVLSSPLKRSVETCAIAGIENFEICPGFREIDTGEWDGRTFDEIRRLYPEEYEARGRDLVHTAPPGGESFEDCAKRAEAELIRVLKKYPSGNLCIFTHAGVMKMLDAFLTGKDRAEAVKEAYPYCGTVCYLLDEGKACKGVMITADSITEPVPDADQCERLLTLYGTPEHVKEHCRAVTAKAKEICGLLNGRGAGLDEKAVTAGAMLHDIARTQKHHAKVGAAWLHERGYTAAAAIVGDHMSLPVDEERISEKSAVFLADKLVRGTQDVTLYERYFPEGLPEEERKYHEIKYEQAVRMTKMMRLDLKGS